jgi:hypothetical protein
MRSFYAVSARAARDECEPAVRAGAGGQTEATSWAAAAIGSRYTLSESAALGGVRAGIDCGAETGMPVARVGEDVELQPLQRVGHEVELAVGDSEVTARYLVHDGPSSRRQRGRRR